MTARATREDPVGLAGIPMTDGERIEVGQIPQQASGEILRMRFNREDDECHEFTPQCTGCRALLRRAAPQSHSESCRARMEALLQQSGAGQRRKRESYLSIHAKLAKQVEAQDQQRKKARLVDNSSSLEGGPMLRIRISRQTSFCREGGCTSTMAGSRQRNETQA